MASKSWVKSVLTIWLGLVVPLALAIEQSTLTNVIRAHYQKGHSTNVFFCSKKDALFMMGQSENQYTNFNIKPLSQVNVEKDLKITFLTSQVLGIFLDLNCDEGEIVLKESSNFFNASYRWFLWTNNANRTDELLRPTRFETDSDVTLLLTSQDDFIVTDVFRMHRTLPTVSTDIFRWTQNNTAIRLAGRPPRNDFQGIQLTGSLLLTDLVINDTKDIPKLFDPSYKPGIDANRRYGSMLFMHMAESYNYTYKFIYSDVWGYPQGANGSWTGMVGQVKRLEADLGMSAVHYSKKRCDIVDFVGCIDITRVCFVFLQPKLFGSYKALIVPLDPIVWLCLFVVTLAGIATFRMVSPFDTTSQHNDSWGGSFLLVIAALSQQGIPDNTEKLSTRFVYVSMLSVSFFAVVYYNTAILNGLLLPAPNAIQNMDQLLASDLKMGLSDAKYLLYDMTLNDSLTMTLRQKMENSKLPNRAVFTNRDGVQMVKKGGFALYIMTRETYPEMQNKFTAAEACSLSEIDKYRPFPTGGIVPNNSPHREIFNRKFTMMRERGLMTRGKLLWNPSKPACDWKQDALVIGAEPLSMAYVVMLSGTLAALAILALELYTKRKLKKKIISPLFVKKQNNF